MFFSILLYGSLSSWVYTRNYYFADHEEKFFGGKGNLNVKILDRRLNNVFKWSWFEYIVSYKDHKGNEQKVMVVNILKKCNKQGLAVCKRCHCTISYSYGSSGGRGGSFFTSYVW